MTTLKMANSTSLDGHELINELLSALSKVQGEIQNPVKEKKNPHFKSTYADLAAGFDVSRKTLAKYGLSILQIPEIHEEKIVLRTRIGHSSGQWIDSFYPVCDVGAHQHMGSAMTYAKRQALFAMIGIAGEDDDDGNTAAEAAAKKSPVQKETVIDRLMTALEKLESAVDIGEWSLIPRVKEAVDGLSTGDKARLEAAKRKRLAELEANPFGDEK